MNTWLPIYCAPLDSTVIDLWHPNYRRLTNYYRVELSPTNVFYEPVGSGPTVVRDASHWMPVCEPPKPRIEMNTFSSTNWLPCPWCGTNKHLRMLVDIWSGKDYGKAICCKDNCCCGPVRKTESAAVKAWQKRVRI